MGGQTFTEAITAVIQKTGGPSRFVGSQFSGLRANGIMFDVILTPDTGKEWDFDDFKEIYVNCNLRRRDADALQLLDNVRLYDILSYSDFVAGVSMALVGKVKEGTNEKEQPVEISGYLGLGFFSLGLDESVELLVTGKPAGAHFKEVQIAARWVYIADQSQRIFGYKSLKSVGGEQAYRDVQGIFYLGPAQEKNATIRDYTGSQSVNLRDSVAFANATGRYEFFTEFGVLYSDPTGVSQDVAISLDGAEDLLIYQEFFSMNKLIEGDSKVIREQEAVLQNIYASRKEKFDVLRQRGNVPAGFTPAL